MREKFLVVYEHGKGGYSGFAPDILGCISVGKTLAQMRSMMKEAIEGHLEFMASDGDPLPTPATSTVDFSEFQDPTGEVDHYVVEWLEVSVPTATHSKVALTA